MNKIMKNIILFFLIIANIIFANEKYLLQGFIFNRNTGEVIPGASIQIADINYGTYSSANGNFRLPLPAGNHNLKISSLGYKTHYTEVTPIDKEIKIFLEPKSINMNEVNVTGDINANELIKRAIKRKNDNLDKIQSFSGELYSKFSVELQASTLSSFNSDGRSVSMDARIGSENQPSEELLIMETFSDNYIDYKNDRRTSIIKQRRQTSNIDANDNLMVLSEYRNFYDDYIKIIETRIISPLNDNALSYYDYEITDKKIYDDKYIYIIQVKPTTTVYPAFTGQIQLIEGTYNLIEVDLKPSNNTAITFVEDLNYIQKFKEVEKNIWYPVYLKISGIANIEVMKGVLEFKADVTALSIFNDYNINKNLPDSLFKDKNEIIKVLKSADSADISYWKNNSLRELTNKELEVYRIQDSIKKDRNDYIEEKLFDYSLVPYLEFNRVASVLIGLNFKYDILKFNTESDIGYSFGIRKPVGKFNISKDLFKNEERKLSVYGDIFSKISSISTDKSILNFYNTLFALFNHEDYYDYFMHNGFSFGLNFKNNNIFNNLNFSLSNQFALKKTTDQSIFTKEEWRANPRIIEGQYYLIKNNFRFGEIDNVIEGSEFNYQFDLYGAYGYSSTIETPFASIESSLDLLIPTIRTGYSPMMLRTLLKAGYTAPETPIQYQFRLPTRLSIISGFGSMYTAPIAEYGGTKYIAAHLQFNTSDLWWRFLRLPLYEGRGIDLTFAYSTAKYQTENILSYIPTDDFYSEIGFGFSRIPTFLSNVIYFSTDFRWGTGSISSDEFGWAISLTVPF